MIVPVPRRGSASEISTRSCRIERMATQKPARSLEMLSSLLSWFRRSCYSPVFCSDSMLDVHITENQITSGDPLCDTFPVGISHGRAGCAAQSPALVSNIKQGLHRSDHRTAACRCWSFHSGSSALHGRPGGGGSRRGPLVSSDPTPRRQHVLSSATLANAAMAIAGSTLLSARAVRH